MNNWSPFNEYWTKIVFVIPEGIFAFVEETYYLIFDPLLD